jgi:large subunit ribosomal protein L17
MLANMACSLLSTNVLTLLLLKQKRLNNLLSLITKSKTDTTHNRRICFAYRSKYAVTDLFRDVAAKVETVQVDTHVSLKLEIVWEIMLIWQ